MSESATPRSEANPYGPQFLNTTRAALAPLETLCNHATTHLRKAVCEDTTGRVIAAALEARQSMAHGLAWLATYRQALEQMQNWAQTLSDEGNLTEIDTLIHLISFGEYLAQISGGIPMSQSETVRLGDLNLTEDEQARFHTAEVKSLIKNGNTQAARTRLVTLLQEHNGYATYGTTGLDDDQEMIREQFRRFVQERIEPLAHEWHLKDELIPLEIIQEMSELGVFGLTIPESYGGLGLSKTAMCVVSEELSRGYIGVGSLGTRSEIAAELILCGGTDKQKQTWLPGLANGEILPTAVFTEPNTGSDLGSLNTRAHREGDVYKVSGAKTWITHAARTHLMTLLARTDPASSDYRGLSMFLAEKTPGTDADPFPTPGMSGGEIEVLGYRGMKEYELGFDNFEIRAENLLGGEEGKGFKQLMETFESARIQTAARAIGVAQSAMDAALRYGCERQQFAQPLIAFPRVSGKIAMMAAEIMIARQLTYYSARTKDGGKRCDLEAGMAKLLAARIAWSAADNSVQIHGGNGFALEYPISRILCDARILSIFEGAAEIQAQVIARRLLG